jgi:hypothetical protein
MPIIRNTDKSEHFWRADCRQVRDAAGGDLALVWCWSGLPHHGDDCFRSAFGNIVGRPEAHSRGEFAQRSIFIEQSLKAYLSEANSGR